MEVVQPWNGLVAELEQANPTNKDDGPENHSIEGNIIIYSGNEIEKRIRQYIFE